MKNTKKLLAPSCLAATEKLQPSLCAPAFTRGLTLLLNTSRLLESHSPNGLSPSHARAPLACKEPFAGEVQLLESQ